MSGTVDSILNFVMPTLIILAVVGFIWTKLLAPSVWPWIKSMMDGAKEQGEYARGKEIVYE